MSTSAEAAVAGCRPADGTPVTIDAEAIESTADDTLRALKGDLADAGLVPSTLELKAAFDADCSLTTQAEADRVRNYLQAATFLGAGTVRLVVEGPVDAAKVEPAVEALRERAEREGLELVVVDPDDL